MSLPSVDEMARAVDAALATYDDNRAWASGIIAVEYAEAFGGMGSASDFKPIDTKEFAERLLAILRGK